MSSEDEASSAYSFPSDDEAGYDSAEYASDRQSDAEEGRADPSPQADSVDEQPPADLDAFRRNWIEDVDSQAKAKPPQQQRAVRQQRPPLPDTAFRRFVLNDDLLPLVLVNPVLSREDIRNLSLAHSCFRLATRQVLFRTVSLSSFGAVSCLLDFFQHDPNLPSCIINARITLGDLFEAATELPDVAASMQKKHEMEEAEPPEMLYDEQRRPMARPPWNKRAREFMVKHGYPRDGTVHGERGPKTLADARRHGQLSYALSLLGASQQLAFPYHLERALARWPFDLSHEPEPFAVLLSHLSPFLTRLKLDFPLSHYIPAFETHLECLGALHTLHIQGEARRTVGYGPAVSLLHAGPPVLDVRPDGQGFRGSPPTVHRLVLKEVVLNSPPSPTDSPPQQAEQPAWRLSELELTSVVVQAVSEIPATTVPPSLEVVPWSALRPPPRASLPPPPPRPLLDLQLFVGTAPSLSNPPRLTTLRLTSVAGVVPRTIAAVVEQSGPTLHHLTLFDLDYPAASLDSSHAARSGTSTNFLSHEFLRPPHALLPPDVEKAAFSALAAASTADHASLVPSADTAAFGSPLAAALSRCTALRTLRLGSSLPAVPGAGADSAFPPCLIDALLVARPPLELLRWRVGVAGGEEGSVRVEGWREFARKVEEVGRWEGLRREQCSVKVEMRDPHVESEDGARGW
ncbi:hypothetical protein JCM10207_007623 [Rhodosporidiobolus poonsookiae]